MPATENLTITVDSRLKTEAEAVFSRKGLDIGEAIADFLRRSVDEETKWLPNAETIAVLNATDKIVKRVKEKGHGRFKNDEEMFAYLKD